MTVPAKGLEGVVAGETEICTVGREGKNLRYRGYSINDMQDARFEEIAYLLLMKKLPTSEELNLFEQDLLARCELPEPLVDALKDLPKETHPMDVLRTGTSLLGCYFPEDDDDPMDSVYRLLATLPSLVLIWHLHHQHKEYNWPQDTGIASRFLSGLHQTEPTPEIRAMMDTSLILYAEHEFNASTFSARITTSTLSDIYSAVCTAIGTLKGNLHGGANEAAMKMIMPLNDEAEADQYITEALDRKEKIMGFGHRVYKISDPRSLIVKRLTKRLAEQKNDMKYYRISEVIEARMKEEKGLFPNLDFYSATFFYLLGIPIHLYTPIFVFGRVAGWASHIMEQRANNRLIRPTADYRGPDAQDWVNIDRRE